MQSLWACFILFFVWPEACDNLHDSEDECDEWAGEGECDINPTWMTRNCRRSCNKCPLEDIATTTSRAVATTTTPSPTTPFAPGGWLYYDGKQVSELFDLKEDIVHSHIMKLFVIHFDRFLICAIQPIYFCLEFL